MKRYNTNTLRTLLMALATNVVTVLVLGDVVNWSAELVATLMATINSGLIVLFYFLKPNEYQPVQPKATRKTKIKK